MHTRLTTGAHSGIHTATNDAGRVVWVGKITHPDDDPTGVKLEPLWDEFSRLMFAYGVEPAQLWPDYSTLVDGEVTDTYTLQEIDTEGNA